MQLPLLRWSDLDKGVEYQGLTSSGATWAHGRGCAGFLQLLCPSQPAALPPRAGKTADEVAQSVLLGAACSCGGSKRLGMPARPLPCCPHALCVLL